MVKTIATKKLSDRIVRLAIPGSCGILSTIATKCHVVNRSLIKFIDKPENLELKALIAEEKEKQVSMAEHVLYKKVKEEDWNAVKYTLDRLGKKRGFDDTQKVQHFGEAGLKITFDNQDVKAIRDKNTIDCEAEIVLDETEGQDN